MSLLRWPGAWGWRMASKETRRKNARTRGRTRSIEPLEDRRVFSADPIGGLLGPSLEHHIVDSAPQFVHHASPDADFWLDSSLERDILSLVGDIQQTLSSAHGSTGLNGVRNDYGFTGAGQTVAVIDSGIAWNHSALGNGFGSSYRVVGGWDFTESDANPYDDGPEGSHGTHVAGIIGADTTGTNNDGVAPGVDLVGLRVFDDSGAGYFSWVESALQWVHQNRNAFENPITAVNLSLGAAWNASSIPSWAMLEDEFAQLKADGIFIAVSAGNSFTSYNQSGLSYPAASPHVVPVMSVMDNGQLSYFSQRHTRAIAAPGQYIVSTVPDYAGNNNGLNDDWASFSGTSMAAPYIAGASVLLREAMQFVGYANITQDTIYSHMMNTATSFYDAATGQSFKRINLTNAFNALMPADEYGSTSGTAHNLGTLGGKTQFIGGIEKLSDADYFQFTAAATGTATFQIATSHSMVAAWSGAGGAASGNTYSFQIVAGQSYTVGLSTSGGVGWYGVTVNAPAAQVTNNAPVLAAIGNKSVTEGNALTFTASATDANAGQSLTYSLGAGAPAGASIHPTTGVFSWTPSAGQGANSYNVTVIVTDNGSPVLSDSETFTITVDEVSVPASEYIRFVSTTTSAWHWGGNNNWVYGTNSDIMKVTMTDTTYGYSTHFNGADVGLEKKSEGVDAFTFLSDGSILVSTSGKYSVNTTYSAPGYGTGAVLTGGGEDILRFTPTTLGDNTTGTWSVYLDGSDVGLSGSAENIDALSVLPDGRIVISTSGKVKVPGIKAEDRDLLIFTPGGMGDSSWGTWAMFFDGSDVGLTKSSEDIDAVYICPWGSNPYIFLSTRGNFSVPGVSGANEDLFAFQSTELGWSTAGTFMPYMIFDGDCYGLPHLDVDGFYFGPAPAAMPEALASPSVTNLTQATYEPTAADVISQSAAFDTFSRMTDSVPSQTIGSRHNLLSSTTAVQKVHVADTMRDTPDRSAAGSTEIDSERLGMNEYFDDVDAWSSKSKLADLVEPGIAIRDEQSLLNAVDELFNAIGELL